jgi:hypothetical protein
MSRQGKTEDRKRRSRAPAMSREGKTEDRKRRPQAPF